MNNISSYCGLTDARKTASEKNLPVTKLVKLIYCNWRNRKLILILFISGEEGEEEEDDPDFDPSKVKPGQNAQECKQQ